MSSWIFMFLTCLSVPILVTCFGSYMKRGKPQERNWILGYRSTLSMKNHDTWIFAQRYCGLVFWRLGWILLLITITTMLLCINADKDTISKVSGIVATAQLFPLIFSIFLVEKRLNESFNKDGSRK